MSQGHASFCGKFRDKQGGTENFVLLDPFSTARFVGANGANIRGQPLWLKEN